VAATPNYVEKLKGFNIHSYIELAIEFKDKAVSRCRIREFLEFHGDLPSECVIDALEQSLKDKAVFYDGFIHSTKNKVPKGYPFFFVGQIDRMSYVVFTKHEMDFDQGY